MLQSWPIFSKKRVVALRKETEKPAEERREAATIVNEAMKDGLFTTPEIIARPKTAKKKTTSGMETTRLHAARSKQSTQSV